uniref:GH18 domain-containing protein n=1 Tax=Quercus lobata TaxID=97700 RepID=A0A7N2KU76_QUELO
MPLPSLKIMSLTVLIIISSMKNCMSISPAMPSSRGIKAAYWSSDDEFPASLINTSFFTHIYYAFLLPKPSTYKLHITFLDRIKIKEFMIAPCFKNSHVKTLIVIGRGNNDSIVFSKNDWEFPANKVDMSSLALLFKEWQKALVNEAKSSGKSHLLITFAVYYASKFMD